MLPSITIIELRDGEKPANKQKVLELLSHAEEFIWISNWFFQPKHLAILRDSLKENSTVSEIRLLLDAPRSVNDLKELKKTFESFQKEFNKISIKIKFITRSKIKSSIHDRFYYTKDQAWNFIEFDSLLRGQRATISFLNPKEFEKNINQDFLKRWVNEKTYDLFDQWRELYDEVKIRQENLEKRHQENTTERLSKGKQNSTFYIYKSIGGITVESKDEILIEVDDAIDELKTLESTISKNWEEGIFSYVGFCNMSTNESLQFLRKSDTEWYAEVPIDDGKDWNGYAYKTFGTLEEMIKTLESFFAEEPFREFLPWKITRFDKWMSDEQKRMDEKKRMKNFSDLK